MAGSQDFTDDARNKTVLALVGDDLVPAAEATVSLFDAGFGLGDGVWEGLRLHQGALLFLDAHLDRLYRGASRLKIDIGLSRDDMKDRLRRLLAANRMEDGAHLRLMVTRGRKATINQDPRNVVGPATIACTAEFKTPPAAPSRGLSVRTVSIRTSGPDIFDMQLNTHSRMNYIIAMLEALDAGADEALMLDPDGNIASCNATNFFWISRGRLFTSGDRFCFNGITRAAVISAARGGAFPLEQGYFPADHLLHAEEAFVTGTMGGITPVREIDGRTLPVRGPVTLQAIEAYAAMKDADAAAHRLI